MNGYSGPSVGLDGEMGRQQETTSHSRSSAWSNMRFERALIKSFSKDGNLAEIETEDENIHSNVRVQTPLELILFLYGQVEKLSDVPCLIMYRSVPQDGFVLIGNLAPAKEEKDSRLINEPFYM